MPEEEPIFIDINALKKTNSWVISLGLSDEEIITLITVVTRVILGGLKLENFFNELTKKINRDKPIITKIALAVAQNRFLPIEQYIGDVRGFIQKLGGEIISKQPVNIQNKDMGQPAVSIPLKKVRIGDATKPALIFSTEDEAEVNGLKKQTSNVQAADYESAANEIIAQFGYNEQDEVFRHRLKNIVMSRLKDVRDEMETREVLLKNKKVGGLEFSEEQVKNLLALIRNKIQNKIQNYNANPQITFIVKKPFVLKQTLTQKMSSEEKRLERSNDLLSAPLSKGGTDTVSPVIINEGGLPVVRMPGEEAMVKPRPVGPEELEPTSAPLRPALGLSPQPAPAPRLLPKSLPPKISRPPSRKPSLDDIKFSKKLVGPVEELSTMTLIDFRRLGERPQEAIRRIQEKIDLLEKDYYGKKLEGINGWHQSEVNRFYRLLGQESMKTGRGVEVIISERIAAGKPTLSIEEFEAVMALNKLLRY